MSSKKHIVFVCTAGKDRSPLAAGLFLESRRWWASYFGTIEVASADCRRLGELRRDVEHATLVAVMNEHHRETLLRTFGDDIDSKIKVLDIGDRFNSTIAQQREALREELLTKLKAIGVEP